MDHLLEQLLQAHEHEHHINNYKYRHLVNSRITNGDNVHIIGGSMRDTYLIKEWRTDNRPVPMDEAELNKLIHLRQGFKRD